MVSPQPTRVLYPISSLLHFGMRTIARVRDRIRPGIRILIFHDIEDWMMPAFDRLVSSLAAARRTINPADAEAIFRGLKSFPNSGALPCLFTFDDGYSSQALAAQRVLNRYGVKGIFFVCPAFLDAPKSNHRSIIANEIYDGAFTESDIPESSSLMDWADVRGLCDTGHTIGSHSMRHRRLSKTNRGDLTEEIVESGDILASRLSTDVRWFAYPFGTLASIDAESLAIISRRYEFCCSGVRGINTRRTPKTALTRDPIELESPIDYQKFVLEGGLDLLFAVQKQKLRHL